MRWLILATFAALLGGSAAAGETMRIGLNEDPDALDPTTGGSFAGRIVFAATCDKLIDLDAKGNLVPQLATSWRWSADGRALTLTLRDGVKFQDGETFDAETARATLEHYKTAKISLRKAELGPVSAVEVVDPHTVRIDLAQAYAPLTAVLADRAGMMLAPKAMARLGDNLASELPCAGPFRLVQRVSQDKIVVERFLDYWNAGAIKLDRIVYRPIPNTSVRLVDLKAGQLDIAERLAPTDAPQVSADPKLRLVTATALAYESISLNVAHGIRSKVFSNPLVREALADAIDRNALNQVVLAGQFVPNNQFQAPHTAYWDPDYPVPPADVAQAKTLLVQAGEPHPMFTLLVGNSSVEQQLGQVIQAMADQAGFDVELQAMDATTQVAAARAGDYEATLVIWSGRPDPDGNVSIWLQCDGFLNWGRYCNKEFDALLAQARAVTDAAARQAVYRKVVDVYLRDNPHIVLYHYRWLWGVSDKVRGFVPNPDGLIRPQGMEVVP
jgi:peptide/nickel transport system substrate-binding protein